MRMRRSAASLTGLLGLALTAGCSGADETASPTGPSSPSVTVAPAPTEPTTESASPDPDAPTEDASENPPEDATADPRPDQPTAAQPTDAQPTDAQPPTVDPGQGGPTGAQPGESGAPGGDPTTDPPVDGLAVPEGSGCTPGEGPLPDGPWYGEVDGADAAGVQFDLACFFLGEEADKAALEDGEAMVPVPNGYYVRNDDPTVRTFDVAGGTQVLHYPTGDPAATQVLDYAEWAGRVADGQVLLLGVWLTVDEGAVVAIEEQWTP